MNTHKVILDCDNTMGLPAWEVDDGLVILYLLGREDIDLLGITNIFGNSSLRNVSHYTKKLLKDLGREDIPRFDGEAYQGQNPDLQKALRGGRLVRLLNRLTGGSITPFRTAVRAMDRYRGESPPGEDPSPAARFLAETAAAHPGEVVLLAAGPVSNLYKASLIDGNFFSNLKEIVIMGGYTRELVLGGRSLPELNLACDPAASRVVLFSGCPITIMNGHICLEAPFGAEDIRRLDFWPEERRAVLSSWLKGFGGLLGIDVFYLWDLLLPVYVSYPELFPRQEVRINPSEIDLRRGMLMPCGEGEGVVINMPEHIADRERFMDILFEAWKKEAELESSGWNL